jgi:hypothetical protein
VGSDASGGIAGDELNEPVVGQKGPLGATRGPPSLGTSGGRSNENERLRRLLWSAGWSRVVEEPEGCAEGVATGGTSCPRVTCGWSLGLGVEHSCSVTGGHLW